MSKSITSHKGISLSGGDRNLTYLYGISDFWAHIFENPEMVHDVLEANTYMMSEAYSKFLQLTSTLSLETIQTTANSQVKLLLLGDAAKVSGTTSTYVLPEEVVACSYIMNRPFLPTETLEADVHFDIDTEAGTIQFNKPIDQYKLPTRITQSGETQYALWMADAQVNEEFIYKHYGKLLNINSQTALDVYKSYVQGLYYLFANGPNIRFLERGLNLVMGVPVSRMTEKVTYIDRHAETRNWIVITDNNSYVIPFGLSPSVNEGDIVEEGTELASWVEVKDWHREDNWWINISIPPEVIPNPPGGDSRAVAGSGVDYLMASYLKRHTFLVRLKTAGVSNFNIFENISEVVSQAKPSYTFPVYIWDVPLEDEVLDIIDSDFSLSAVVAEADNAASPAIEDFRRDTSKAYRGNPVFMRSNVPMKADNWLRKFEDDPILLEFEGDGELFGDPTLNSGSSSAELIGLVADSAGGTNPNLWVRVDDNYEGQIGGRYAASTTFHNDVMWVYGGVNNSGYRDDLWWVDPTYGEYGSWFIEKSHDGTRGARASMVGYGSHLYFVGGQPDDATKNRMFWRMEIGIGTFTQLPDLPEDMPAPKAAVVGDKMYVIGMGNSSASVWEYDFIGTSWTQKNDAPKANTFHTLVVVGTNIYVVSGSSGSTDPATIQIYDTTNDTWSTSSSWGVTNSDQIAAAVGTKIYIFGGSDNTGTVVGTSYVYDTATDTWEDLQEMDSYYKSTEAVEVGGDIYFGVGWKNTNAFSSELWKFDVSETVPNYVTGTLVPTDDTYIGELAGKDAGLELNTQGPAADVAMTFPSGVIVESGETYDVEIDLRNINTDGLSVYIRDSIGTVDIQAAAHVDLTLTITRRQLLTASFTAGSTGEYFLSVIIPAGASEHNVRVYRVSMKKQGAAYTLRNNGVVAMQEVYEKNGYYEGWMSGLMTRANPSSTFSRGHVNYHGRASQIGTGVGVGTSIASADIAGAIKAGHPETADSGLYIDHGKLIGLYSAREQELLDKITNLGYSFDELPEAVAIIPDSMIDSYYDLALRDSAVIDGDTIGDNFYDRTYLNFATPKEGYRVRVVGIRNVAHQDFLVAMRSYDDVYTVYLYSHKNVVMAPYLGYDSSPENLKITVNATELYRGGLAVDSQVYLTRGAMNDQYTDGLTPTPVTVDRNNALGGTVTSEKENV